MLSLIIRVYDNWRRVCSYFFTVFISSLEDLIAGNLLLFLKVVYFLRIISSNFYKITMKSHYPIRELTERSLLRFLDGFFK
jgi:hypothetical protein